MEKISEKIGVVLLLLLVIVSGMALVFEDQFDALASFLDSDRSAQVDNSGRVLRVAYLFAPKDLNPFSTEPATQSRLLDVYEPLVRVDENLNMQPLLAVNYGLFAEKNWEFQIRQGVKFHDGKDLTVDDVIYSFNQAKARPGSYANDLVASVEEISKSADQKVLIVTKQPDPLLLIKLAKLPIIKEGFNNFTEPVGTGPYQLTETSDLSVLKYQRNNYYWGKAPFFGYVEVLAQQDKNIRVNDLLNGNINFLVDVPPDAVEDLQERKLSVKFMPSLEVGFVMFNLQDKNFSQRTLREAVAEALNRQSFLDLAYGRANVVNQFVPSGVFGYDPDLQGIAYDPEEAQSKVNNLLSGFEKVNVDFFYPQSLKLLGQYFKEQLSPIGINLELYPLTDLELQDKLLAGEMGFFYLGWRNETGDALPFLKAVLHSKNERGYGVYNGINYSDAAVDKLIEASEVNFDLVARLADMQEVMRKVVEEDIVGVPLFETQSIFAFAKDLQFSPRVDSLVLPSTIRSKQI